MGIIIIAVLMMVGCNNVIINKQTDTSNSTEEKKENSETGTIERIDKTNSSTSSPTTSLTSSQTGSPTNDSTNSPTNYVKTYNDETHTEIFYGKLSFKISSYHIVSDMHSGNTETYKCEVNKGETWPESHITITIREIEKQNFLDNESIISYLSDISPNYENIEIYNNVTDGSGIINLYGVTGGGLINYFVCYRDACYKIESDYSYLGYDLSNGIPANYEVNKLKIECADSYTTHVNEAFDNDNNRVEYEIIQGKDGSKYSAELSCDEDCQYHFTLKNENGDILLTLSIDVLEIKDVIKIIDVNRDGYADIQLLEDSGTLNNSYALYVWDDSVKNFVKVKCDEMLSHFEVHNGYLLNWAKNDAQSGVKQKLVWDKKKNTLIKESEEHYQVN